MFTGKRSSYTGKGEQFTMVVNIDRESGAFTALVWDGFEAQYAKDGKEALVGTFSHGKQRIQVLVYGGKIPHSTILALLRAWIGGKWQRMTLQSVLEGATIPKGKL